MMCDAIICSNNLQIMQVSETGLQFDGLERLRYTFLIAIWVPHWQFSNHLVHYQYLVRTGR